MADKARDLQFRVLSDLSRLDVDKAARELSDLGDDGKRALDKLDDSVDRAGKRVGDYADDARDAARKIGRAFDDIGDASHKSSRKIDGDLDDAKRGLDDFKEEAHSSGREAAASFGGGFDDVGDFIQETAANAFGGFGPLGAAAGTVAAIGIGIATKAVEDAKQRAQEAKDQIKDFFDAFVEGQGKVTEASITGRLSDLLGDPDQFAKIKKEAAEASVSVELYARALAGDPDAVAKLREQIDATADSAARRYTSAFADAADATGQLGRKQDAIIDPTRSLADLTSAAAAAQNKQTTALGKVGSKLDDVKNRLGDATDAYNVLSDATRAGITIGVKIPSPRELDEINRRMRSGIGEIVVPLRPGQPRNENNANNSRYRW